MAYINPGNDGISFGTIFLLNELTDEASVTC